MKNQLKALENPIKHCKICFKLLKNNDLYEIINGDSCLCETCQNRLVPRFIKFEILGIDGLAIYEYDDNFKSLLYQFKGCYDIELALIFLNKFKNEINLMYHGYVIAPAPSYYLEDEKRGFKHVEKIFENVNLPILDVFKKTAPFKQAEHKRKQRKGIVHYLKLVFPEKLKGKKVLIVDDVCTTGATLKALVMLVRTAKPKTIKILVVSKREVH